MKKLGVSGLGKGVANDGYFKQLRAGSYITEKFLSLNEFKIFTFRIDLSDDQDSLSVNLAPIVGKFVFAVRNDGAEPRQDQGYWVTSENHLLIQKSDANFKNNVDYFIKVWP